MNGKLSKPVWSILILLLVAPASALANGFRLPNQDAAATARGEAFVATADNPSAVYYNPAGITQLRGHNLRVGSYNIYYKTKFTSGSGQSYETKDAFSPVPHVYYTYMPEKLPLAFGLGMYSPYGLGVEWPQDTGFRTIGLESRLTYITVNPVMAWKVNSHLSVAAGPTINYSQTEFTQGLLPSPGPDYFKFKGDDTAFGFNAGIHWKPHDKVTFGFTYRSTTTMDYQGHTEATAFFPPRYDTSASLAFPQDLVIGISYRPTPKWNLEFNLDWTDWSRLHSLAIQQPGVPPVILNWNASFLYAFGVTRDIGKDWRLSVGYVFNENSTPNATYNPLLPDLDRHFASVGVGYHGKRFSFDAGYQFSYGPGHTVNGSTSSPPFFQSADGRYEWLSHAFIVSAGWRF